MKSFLPIFALALVLLLPCCLLAQQPPSTVNTQLSSQELLATAIQQLGLIQSLEARVRQRVRMFDQDLIGSGIYLQHGSGSRTLARLELNVQLGDDTSQVLYIRGQQYLLKHQVVFGQNRTVRIDLNDRVARAAREAGQGRALTAPQDWLCVGGISEMLACLQNNFDMLPPQELQLDSMPAWSVQGSWKKDVIQSLLPHHAHLFETNTPQALAQLPEQIPHEVRLTLSRDPKLPLFPHRIEYLRYQRDRQNEVRLRPVITIEFFEVGRTNVNLNLFTTELDDFEDHTDIHIDRLLKSRGGSKPQ